MAFVRFKPGEIESFLRTATRLMLQTGEEVEDGCAAVGPGEMDWLALECADGLSDPPRPTIRWIPQDGTDPPQELLERGEVPEFDEQALDEDVEDDELDEEFD